MAKEKFQCPIDGCKKNYKPAGLVGHIRSSRLPGHGEDAYLDYIARGGINFMRYGLDHGAVDEGESKPLAAIPRAGPVAAVSDDLVAKRRRAEGLELDARIALAEGKLAARAKYPDLSEQSGLGEFAPDIKSQIQSRAFAASPEKTNWLEGVLKPENLTLIVGALKGMLGLGSGSGIQEALQLFGCSDVPSLMSKMNQGIQTVQEDFTLPNGKVVSKGTPMYPELITAYLKDGQADPYLKTFEDVFARLSPAIEEWVLSKQAARGVTSEPGPPGENFTTVQCSECGRDHKVGYTGEGDGAVLEFKCKNCGHEEVLTGYIPESPAKQRRVHIGDVGKAKGKKAGMPTKYTVSCDCGQLCELPGEPYPGQWVKCGVCSKEFQLISDTIAIPALEPEAEGVAARSHETEPQSLYDRNLESDELRRE